MEDKNKVLIIVDFQKDFYHKTEGSLYVPGAEDALKNILSYIENNHNKIKECIFTVDWHTPEDKSFAKNGGQWPVHCLMYSEGASINNEIMNTLIKNDIGYFIFEKGAWPDHEEYGAFEKKKEYTYEKGFVELYNYLEDDCIDAFLTNDYVICGLAGDYCVYQTYKNLRNHGFNVEPFYDGMSFIGEKFDFKEKYNTENTND